MRVSGSAAAVLRERWSARSLRSVWPGTAAEWSCAELDAVCAGLVASGAIRADARRACHCLGEQRFEVGAQLHEARTDLDIGLGLAGARRRRRLELLDALTVGWAEHAVDRLCGVPVVDVRADMATAAYLVTRIRELYREADATGGDVSRAHLLVIVETAYTGDRLLAETRLTTLHSAMEFAFVGGESIAAVTPRRAVVLAAREEPRLSDSLARLRSELKIALAEGRLPGARMWRQPLPARLADLPLTLAGVLN